MTGPFDDIDEMLAKRDEASDLDEDELSEENFDEEDESPPYGQPGAMENPDIHIKWIVDGAESLAEVAIGLRAYAVHCESLVADGWDLSEPVDNSHGFVHYTGPGDPPRYDWQKGEE